MRLPTTTASKEVHLEPQRLPPLPPISGCKAPNGRHWWTPLLDQSGMRCLRCSRLWEPPPAAKIPPLRILPIAGRGSGLHWDWQEKGPIRTATCFVQIGRVFFMADVSGRLYAGTGRYFRWNLQTPGGEVSGLSADFLGAVENLARLAWAHEQEVSWAAP